MNEVLGGCPFPFGDHEKEVIQGAEIPQFVHEKLEGTHRSLDEAEDVRLKLQSARHQDRGDEGYQEYHQDSPIFR